MYLPVLAQNTCVMLAVCVTSLQVVAGVDRRRRKRSRRRSECCWRTVTCCKVGSYVRVLSYGVRMTLQFAL